LADIFLVQFIFVCYNKLKLLNIKSFKLSGGFGMISAFKSGNPYNDGRIEKFQPSDIKPVKQMIKYF